MNVFVTAPNEVCPNVRVARNHHHWHDDSIEDTTNSVGPHPGGPLINSYKAEGVPDEEYHPNESVTEDLRLILFSLHMNKKKIQVGQTSFFGAKYFLHFMKK